jgi:hypothetical protein
MTSVPRGKQSKRSGKAALLANESARMLQCIFLSMLTASAP